MQAFSTEVINYTIIEKETLRFITEIGANAILNAYWNKYSF